MKRHSMEGPWTPVVDWIQKNFKGQTEKKNNTEEE